MEQIKSDAGLDQLLEKINEELEKKPSGVVVAIDGRCASGKTTASKLLQERIPCSVIHMDDFFLRPEQRTQERYSTPGGNVDYERFLAEVGPQLRNGKQIIYVPFDCKKMSLAKQPIVQKRHSIIIVEGSYSCHPELFELYDIHCFFTVNESVQRKRIVKRNGIDVAKMFEQKWIPLEEMYFTNYEIMKKCDIIIDRNSEV